MRTWDGGQNLHLAGHSNGCDILRLLLLHYPEVKVKTLDFIAAAVDPDFEANGLNEVLCRGQVGRMRIWCSNSDEALYIAKNTGGFLRFMGNLIGMKWGYGYMGLTGPTKQRDMANVICEPPLWFPGYRHSDYFSDANFESTMGLILNG
jgi:pimeloyl-ACP methyl ester carboxylesterase